MLHLHLNQVPLSRAAHGMYTMVGWIGGNLIPQKGACAAQGDALQRKQQYLDSFFQMPIPQQLVSGACNQSNMKWSLHFKGQNRTNTGRKSRVRKMHKCVEPHLKSGSRSAAK